jgi:hypothetical protein
MLVSCEVAVEYYLAMIHSPQARRCHCAAPQLTFSVLLSSLWAAAPCQRCSSAQSALSSCAPLQIQWLQQADDAWPLQQEVEGEVDAAYRFIIDREIEAPDRFQAIQSYRWVPGWPRP